MDEDKPLTKAERKALRKQEKLAQRESINRKRSWSKVGWIVLSLIILGLIGWWGYSRYVPVPTAEKNKVVNQVLTSDWYLGNKDAAVVIVEYSDFQCPACQLFSPLIKQMEKEYPGKIAIVYRHFPLKQIHLQAELAAAAAEAAGKQGKFWEMNELLFEKQKEWSEKRNAKSIFIGYANSLGLNEEQFKRDLSSKEVYGLVKADYMSGLTHRLNSTPSFFINGERMANPQGAEAFREIIEMKLKEATAAAQINN